MDCSIEDTNTELEALPITSLSSLLNWKSEDISAVLKESLDDIPNLASSNVPINRPKTLICHDMKGGYIEDRFLKGCNNADAYRLVHWSGIDSFVYFSHKFVTIPPPGWTAAAHRNGVPVLGTVITESKEGSELCLELFSSMQCVERAVQQLVDIAVAHKMQGWLINIENELSSDSVGLVMAFLRGLTRAMRGVDELSCVVWYDSVTDKGTLEWQDQLNDRNVYFYDACDAIFLNYSWKESQLESSKGYARDLPSRKNLDGSIRLKEKDETLTTNDNNQIEKGNNDNQAESDKDNDNKLLPADSVQGATKDKNCATEQFGEETKVYVGVDVFGRNFYEGGGFNCNKALQVIREQGLSAAVFAPGWTHEVLGCKEFPSNDLKFWSHLSPYLYEHGPTTWPLYSHFSEGRGAAYYKNGQVCSTEPWFNLSEQSLMPRLTQSGVALIDCDAYHAGGCLQITSRPGDESISLWNSCELECGSAPLELTLLHKSGRQQQQQYQVCCTTHLDSAATQASFVIELTTAGDREPTDQVDVRNGWVRSTVCVPSPGHGVLITSVQVTLQHPLTAPAVDGHPLTAPAVDDRPQTAPAIDQPPTGPAADDRPSLTPPAVVYLGQINLAPLR